MEFTVRSAPITHLVVRGVEKTEVTIKNAVESVRVVQSASPVPLGIGTPMDINGGSF